MDDRQRREFHEALLDADSFEDLPGKVAGGDSQGGAGPATAPPSHWRLATAGRSAPDEPTQLRGRLIRLVG